MITTAPILTGRRKGGNEMGMLMGRNHHETSPRAGAGTMRKASWSIEVSMPNRNRSEKCRSVLRDARRDIATSQTMMTS
eukprot:307494-Rhodomonas_salina.3